MLPIPVKIVFSKLTNVIFVVAMAALVIYMIERNQTITDIVYYYGNVSTKSEFRTGDTIESYSFGTSTSGKPIKVKFINQLWCSPIYSFERRQLIDTQIYESEAHTGFNSIGDDIFARAIEANTTLSQIGSHDREIIRKTAKEKNYIYWPMIGITPDVSSECFITAEVTVYTRVFNIEKKIQFDGNYFNYIVE